MNEIRCPHCNKMLLKGNFKGVIEIKCSRCGKIHKLTK